MDFGFYIDLQVAGRLQVYNIYKYIGTDEGLNHGPVASALRGRDHFGVGGGG